jgi:phosphoribosyl 1,2-cyclic phosphate phosphodiesterase
MHGNMPILGYIFREQTNTHQPSPNTQSIAYITDMKSIEDSEYEYLHDIDTLVINALRFEKPHHSHQLVDDAIAVSRRIGAKRTYLIHLTHDIGTHEIANSRLPEGFEFAYDGQIIEC